MIHDVHQIRQIRQIHQIHQIHQAEKDRPSWREKLEEEGKAIGHSFNG